MNRISSSFRDPSGYVYESNGSLYRYISQSYQNDWKKIESFLIEQVQNDKVVAFSPASAPDLYWKAIELQRLPFISFPYEWSFSQLQDAALLTLSLHRAALSEGLILKDASAFNIQFHNSRPIFIDHLSFEVWDEGKPWAAYRQFCSHFLAPLCLMAFTDLRCGALLKNWLDGIPLDMAVSMLPFQKRFRAGLYFHLYLHARLQRVYADAGRHAASAKKAKVTRNYLVQFAASLERVVSSLKLPKVNTEWGDYYDDTNYSAEAEQSKLAFVADLAQQHTGELAVDVGANTGKYTRLMTPHFSTILAVDIDPLAVNRHYCSLRDSGDTANVLPLCMDIANPSPSLGFNCSERPSFIQRCEADFILALAVIHHLRITSGIPLEQQSNFFSSLLKPGGVLIIEFVPKEDSQTQRLLALREDIFEDYSLEACKKTFANHFDCIGTHLMPDSARSLLIFKKVA